MRRQMGRVRRASISWRKAFFVMAVAGRILEGLAAVRVRCCYRAERFPPVWRRQWQPSSHIHPCSVQANQGKTTLKFRSGLKASLRKKRKILTHGFDKCCRGNVFPVAKNLI